MPTDRRDLSTRIAAATRADTVRGLIFNAAFDVAREHGGDALALAVDPLAKGKRTDFLSYPVADFLNLSWSLAERLAVKLGGADAAFRQMGYRATSNVLGSMLGTTMLAFGRSPRALLSQASSAYRGTVSYGERTLTWEGPSRARFVFTRDFMNAPFHEGVLRAALDGTGAAGPSVVGRATGFLSLEFEISWE